MKNLNTTCAIFLLIASMTFQSQAQSEVNNSSQNQRVISGKVTDQHTGENVIFAMVILYKDSLVVTGTETDLDGNYSFSLSEPGPYLIEVISIGYQPKKVKEINAKEGQINKVDIVLSQSTEVYLEEIVVIAHKRPPVSFDHTSSGTTVVKRNSIRKVNQKNRSVREEFNTEEYSHIVENKFISPKDEALSTFSIDVDRASYSNVRRFINDNKLPPIDAVRIEEMINYFPYEYDDPSDDTPFSIEHNLVKCPWNSKNQILHIGVQGKRIERNELPPSNMVFLVDVSGSMATLNKLELVKSSLNLLVDNLRAEDKIALVVYAGSAGLVLESTSGTDKSKIKTAIQNLSAGGSTAGGAGIQLAYKVAKENFIKDGNNRVILATDGDFNIGISDEGSLVRMIEKKREENIFLSVLGYGMGNYKDNKMQSLADSGNGNHSYIDNLTEAKKILIEEFGGTLFAIAKDVKIQIEFNPEFVSSYKLIGYENRLLDKEDFNNDKKDAGDLGAGHSVTAFYEIIPKKFLNKQKSKVDKLKYQTSSSVENHAEFATIKMRYKKPKGTKSQKIEEVIPPNLSNQVSSDVSFGLCVAEFGMQLRESEEVEHRSFSDLLESVQSINEVDENGYRSEFLSLIERVIHIKKVSEDDL